MTTPPTPIGVTLLQDHSPRIVTYGVSCSGKTTLARHIPTHAYSCFDALFHWHAIETLGGSIEANLKQIQGVCIAPKFVLDGWHIADRLGEFLPDGVTVYVVYCSYLRVAEQFRERSMWKGKRERFWEHLPMFRKWYYDVPYHELAVPVRYFQNLGDCFLEREQYQFAEFLEGNRDLPYP